MDSNVVGVLFVFLFSQCSFIFTIHITLCLITTTSPTPPKHNLNSPKLVNDAVLMEPVNSRKEK